MPNINNNTNKRKKIKRDTRIEVRCTSEFKALIDKVAVLYNMTTSSFIEAVCTDEITRYLTTQKSRLDNPFKPNQENTHKKANGSKPINDPNHPFLLSPQTNIADTQKQIGIEALELKKNNN